MKVQEAIKRIEEGHFYSVFCAESVLENAKLVKSNLDIDEHGWYIISTNV